MAGREGEKLRDGDGLPWAEVGAGGRGISEEWVVAAYQSTTPLSGEPASVVAGRLSGFPTARRTVC